MNGVPDKGGSEAVEYALSHLVLHLFDCIEATNHGVSEEEAGRRMASLVTNWTMLMGCSGSSSLPERERRSGRSG
jgi:hypothetical protein